jgi:hypothetical protein
MQSMLPSKPSPFASMRLPVMLTSVHHTSDCCGNGTTGKEESTSNPDIHGAESVIAALKEDVDRPFEARRGLGFRDNAVAGL